APGIYLGDDSDSGLYRIGPNNLGLALGGAKVVDFAASGVAITGTLSASGAVTFGGAAAIAGDATVGGTFGVTGLASFGAGVAVTGGAGGTGSIWKSSSAGLVIQGATGTLYDVDITTPGALRVIGVPTGTRNVDIVGSLAWGGGGAIASSNDVVTSTGANTFSGLQTMNAGLQVGSGGATVTGILTGTKAVAGTNIAANGEVFDVVSVPGAAVGDAAFATPDAYIGIVDFTCEISAADTVRIRYHNPTAATVSMNAHNMRVFVFQV
ncbi:MAG TPA: hypothetical protein VF158_00015, partial [Longimicrobiales bacterium]